jgi:hypothetical protein
MDQRSKDFVRSRLADPAWLVRANPRLVIASLESAADRPQLATASGDRLVVGFDREVAVLGPG